MGKTSKIVQALDGVRKARKVRVVRDAAHVENAAKALRDSAAVRARTIREAAVALTREEAEAAWRAVGKSNVEYNIAIANVKSAQKAVKEAKESLLVARAQVSALGEGIQTQAAVTEAERELALAQDRLEIAIKLREEKLVTAKQLRQDALRLDPEVQRRSADEVERQAQAIIDELEKTFQEAEVAHENLVQARDAFKTAERNIEMIRARRVTDPKMLAEAEAEVERTREIWGKAREITKEKVSKYDYAMQKAERLADTSFREAGVPSVRNSDQTPFQANVELASAELEKARIALRESRSLATAAKNKVASLRKQGAKKEIIDAAVAEHDAAELAVRKAKSSYSSKWQILKRFRDRLGGGVAVTGGAQNLSEEDKPYPIVETVGGTVLGVVDTVEEVIADGASIGPCIMSGFTVCDAGDRAETSEKKIVEKVVIPVLTSETAAPVVDPLIGGLGKASDGIDRSLTVGIKGMESAGSAVVNAFTPRGGTIRSALAQIEEAKAQSQQGAITNSGVVKDNRAVWALAEAAGRKKGVSEKQAEAPEVGGANFTLRDNFTPDTIDAASQPIFSLMP
ncbi:MAG: hypothetical protein K1X66_00320 [Verrucomicrobiae bacterium]|nr:hypothetical protein [Verrucomicrobiae bacterium]